METKYRYFYVCTLGKKPNGALHFTVFAIALETGHPTLRMCRKRSNEISPNLSEVTLVSICEIPESDWNMFVSEF